MKPGNCPFQKTNGGIACVTKKIDANGGEIYVNNRKIKAHSKEKIGRGQWVRITKKGKNHVYVTKINVHLASCCC
jgi:membrane-bound ClpP family serine protease